MSDARFQRSRLAIKEALLRLLNQKPLVDIAMQELASEAHVSRSTLYVHFGNVEEVYTEVVHDFAVRLRPLQIHLRCDECSAASTRTRPFCVALREAGTYLALVEDTCFLPTLLDDIEQAEGDDDLFSTYYSLGLSKQLARAVFRFQMSGCYTAALSGASQQEWPLIQQTLDTFIRGGIQALRTAGSTLNA